MDDVFGALRPAESGEPARWVFDALTPFLSYEVGSFVPPSFPACAALAHDDDPTDHEFDGVPDEQAVARLAEFLATATTTPDRAWFCLWEGSGWMSLREGSLGTFGAGRPRPSWRERRAERRAIAAWRRRMAAVESLVARTPLVGTLERRHHLFVGPVAAATDIRQSSSSFQTPTVWWPDDRAWIVSSDVGLPWTYVGAQPAVVDEIRALWPHPTRTVAITDQIRWD